MNPEIKTHLEHNFNYSENAQATADISVVFSLPNDTMYSTTQSVSQLASHHNFLIR